MFMWLGIGLGAAAVALLVVLRIARKAAHETRTKNEETQFIDTVSIVLDKFGFTLTDREYVKIYRAIYEGPHNPIEVAVWIALHTMAHESKNNCNSIFSLEQFDHAVSINDLVWHWQYSGACVITKGMEIDLHAMLNVSAASPERAEWVEQVLNDPFLAAAPIQVGPFATRHKPYTHYLEWSDESDIRSHPHCGISTSIPQNGLRDIKLLSEN